MKGFGQSLSDQLLQHRDHGHIKLSNRRPKQKMVVVVEIVFSHHDHYLFRPRIAARELCENTHI
jgi:hypothetical protein